jgi:4-hydroxy-3-polyprenylbenzoate decarboxylase
MAWCGWWTDDGRSTGYEEAREGTSGGGNAAAGRLQSAAQSAAETSGASADVEPEGRLNRLPVVVAVTGASGAPYARRLLEVLATHQIPTWLIVSSHGWRLLQEECGIGDLAALQAATGGDWRSVTVFGDEDRGGKPASGSQRTAGMVICPCSMGTVAAVAHGTSRSLVERAADVTLKERRPLVLVPRETPLSLVHLRNLTAATEAGAVVLPAAPGFYHRPTTVDELVDFVVQRVLDHLGVEIQIAKRWEG